MMLFVFGSALTLAVIGALLWPYWRPEAAGGEAGATDKDSREVALYQDQLAEVARDQDRGVLTAVQAKSATQEIERRLLIAARRADQAGGAQSRGGRLGLVIGAALLPLAAGSLYVALGAPDQPSRPFAARPPVLDPTAAAPTAGSRPDMRAQIDTLQERLAQTPDDADGQILLARSYASIRRFDEAIAAYRTANRLTGGQNRRLAGELAEVMVVANDGAVSAEAQQIFERIRADFPQDPQARYYLALALAQGGQTDAALSALTALRQDAPNGAPWLGTVDQLIAQLDPAREAAPADRRFDGPSDAQMAAAATLSREQQDAMIQNMVEGLAVRLEETPDDLEGWRRLARAYEVLGDTEKAAQAHRRVQALAPDDPDAATFFSP